jgi:hypothetical protein
MKIQIIETMRNKNRSKKNRNEKSIEPLILSSQVTKASVLRSSNLFPLNDSSSIVILMAGFFVNPSNNETNDLEESPQLSK